MRLFLTFAIFGAVVEAGKGSGNNKQVNKRKQERKAFRQCKNRHCKEECPAGEFQSEDCMNCLDIQKCPLPRRLSKAIDCAKEKCENNCTEDLFANECMECRVSECENKKKPGNQGQSRPSDPLSTLRKYVSGGPAQGRRNKPMSISDGTRAYHRCAMGMCYKNCILEPVDDVACEECITSLCIKASENYTCVNAERENKYFFCAKPSDCTGPDAGGIRVAGKSCPKAYYCCHWGE